METVVALSMVENRQMLTGQKSLVKFFRESPMVGVELDLTRDKSLERDNFVINSVSVENVGVKSPIK